MKTVLKKSGNSGAVVLPMTICTFAILSIFVVSYLWMVAGQHRSIARAQAWNLALTVAEAGIEEGMAQLNAGGAGVGVNINLAANNWTDNMGTYGYYGPKIGYITNAFYSAQYSVTIKPGANPVVTASATVIDPLNSQPIQRTVQVITTPYIPQNNHGIISITNSTLTGNFNVISGNVASVSGNVTLRNADVLGTVETGGPTPSTTANSTVTGGFNTNFYANLPDVQPPFTSGFPPPSDAANGKTGSINFGMSGHYYINGDYNKNNLPITVTATNVVLYVTGNINVSSLVVAPGASFTLYVGTPDTSSSSSTSFGKTSSDTVNATGTPGQFLYYGLPSNKTIQFPNGLTSFVGIIYAPEADLKQQGNVSIYGSLVVNSYTARGGGTPGNLTLRDVSDSGALPVIGYAVNSWAEL